MKLSKKQRAELHGKFGGRCAYCGCPLPERWQADHLEPVFRDSKLVRQESGFHKRVFTGELLRPHLDTMENLMPSCSPCNNYKHALSLEEFRKAVGNFNGVLARGSSTYRNAVRFGLIQETPKPIVFYFESLPPVGDGKGVV